MQLRLHRELFFGQRCSKGIAPVDVTAEDSKAVFSPLLASDRDWKGKYTGMYILEGDDKGIMKVIYQNSIDAEEIAALEQEHKKDFDDPEKTLILFTKQVEVPLCEGAECPALEGPYFVSQKTVAGLFAKTDQADSKAESQYYDVNKLKAVIEEIATSPLATRWTRWLTDLLELYRLTDYRGKVNKKFDQYIDQYCETHIRAKEDLEIPGINNILSHCYLSENLIVLRCQYAGVPKITIYDNGKCYDLQTEGDEQILAIAAHSGHLITYSNSRIAVWDVLKNQSRTLFMLPPLSDIEDMIRPRGGVIPPRLIIEMLISPTGQHIVASYQGKVYLWDLEKKEANNSDVLIDIGETGFKSHSMQFLPNGKLAVYSFIRNTNKQQITVIDLNTKQTRTVHEANNMSVNGQPCLSAASDKYLLYNDGNSKICLLDMESNNTKEIYNYKGYLWYIVALTDNRFGFTTLETYHLTIMDFEGNELAECEDISTTGDCHITPNLMLSLTRRDTLRLFDVGLLQLKMEQFKEVRQAIASAHAETKIPVPVSSIIAGYVVGDDRTHFGMFQSGKRDQRDFLAGEIDLLHQASDKSEAADRKDQQNINKSPS